MGWFDIGGAGKAIWGAVARPFSPPPPAPPAAATMQRDAARIRSGGVERLRQSSLIDWRYPPVEGKGGLISNNTGSLIGNNSGGLISNNTASFNKPWWRLW